MSGCLFFYGIMFSYCQPNSSFMKFSTPLRFDRSLPLFIISNFTTPSDLLTRIQQRRTFPYQLFSFGAPGSLSG